MFYAIAPMQPIHVSKMPDKLKDFLAAKAKTKEKQMFAQDMINRIYEYSKTTSISMSLLNACISNPPNDQKITPEYIEDCYAKLETIAKKIAGDIEAGEKSYRDKNQINPIKDIVNPTPVPISSSSSFGMRRAQK